MNFIKLKYPVGLPDRLSLLVIVTICVVTNAPYFLNDYYPVHDTLSVFQIFSYYYSELVVSGAFPWWMPLTSFGMPVDSHLLFSFGPFQYLTLVIGYFLGVNNTLYLFSTSLALDSLLLGLGAFLFCQHLLKDRFSSLVCVVSVLVLVLYDRQVYWNFKILVPLPLVLYFAQRGLEQMRPAYLLWAAAVLLSCSFGSVTYALVAQVYIVAFYCLVFWISAKLLAASYRDSITTDWARLKAQLTRRAELVYLLPPMIVISACLAMMYAIRSVMSTHMAYNALGRTGGNLGVDLTTFLTYGGNGEIDKLFEIFNGLPTSNPHDYLTYIGVVNFGFVLIGLLSLRKQPDQIALLLTAIVVMAFTVVASGVAELVYALPGMNLVRHIAYFVTVAKLLLIIFAGFGVKALMQDGMRLRYISLIVAGLVCLWYTPVDKANLYSLHAAISACVLIAFVGLVWIFKVRLRLLLWGCVFISLADLVSYRVVVFKMADLFLVEFPVEFKSVQIAPYRSVRIEEGEAVVLKRYRLKPMNIYGGGDSYLREDFCKGSRQDMISSGVKQLFQLRVWRDRIMTEPRDALDAHGDQALRNVLGCGVPKLRFVSGVSYARDEETAASKVCCATDIYERPVIIAAESEEIKRDIAPLSDRNLISVEAFSPNELRMSVLNNEATSLWLIYADAFDDNWKLTVDGVSHKLYKANLAFKALKIAPGQHEIRLVLERPIMNVLFAVFVFVMSALAAAVVGLFFWGLLGRRKTGLMGAV